MTQGKFGKALRGRRLERDLTQGEMAKRLNVSVAHYSALETSRKLPSMAILNALVVEFGLSPEGARSMHSLVAESVDQVRINLDGASKGSREAAVSFARRFDSLSTEKIEQLRKLLDE